MVKESKEVVAAKSAVAKDTPKKQIDVSKGPVKLKVKEFEALMADYKTKNPVKYEMKKDILEKQLKSLS